MIRRCAYVVLPTFLVALSGCSSALRDQGPLLDRLTTRGPVLLSSENPYLPADRLLAAEAEQNSELNALFALYGPPEALEVHRGMISSRVTLYFPEKNILVPFTIGSSGWKKGEPVAIPDDASDVIAKLAAERMSPVEVVASNQLHTQVPADAKASIRTPSALLKRNQPPPAPPALRRDKAGNYLYTISNPKETLSSLAKWFTGSAANTDALAKASKIRNPKLLKYGQTVVVPKSLMRNPKAPLERDLRM